MAPRAIILSLGFIAIATTAIGDEDCEYAQQKLQSYLANCQSFDGCANRDKMVSVMRGQCGASEPNQPPSVAPIPATPSPPRSTSGTPPPALSDYSGQSCAFFTRPSIESSGGTTRMNYYAEGAMSCYQGKMYKCENLRWKFYSNCTSSSPLSAEKQEKGDFEKYLD